MEFRIVEGGEASLRIFCTNIPPQGTDSLRVEAERLLKEDPSLANVYKNILEALQSNKSIRFAPVMVEGIGLMPIVYLSIMPTIRGGRPEATFGVTVQEAKDLIDAVFPLVEGNTEENSQIKDYRKELTEYLEKGNRLGLFPPRKLN